MDCNCHKCYTIHVFLHLKCKNMLRGQYFACPAFYMNCSLFLLYNISLNKSCVICHNRRAIPKLRDCEILSSSPRFCAACSSQGQLHPRKMAGRRVEPVETHHFSRKDTIRSLRTLCWAVFYQLTSSFLSLLRNFVYSISCCLYLAMIALKFS